MIAEIHLFPRFVFDRNQLVEIRREIRTAAH